MVTTGCIFVQQLFGHRVSDYTGRIIKVALETFHADKMWIVVPFCFFAALQAFKQIQDVKRANRAIFLQQLEDQANFYGRLWSRMLISRQMFEDFSAMEGYKYPEDFVLLGEAINEDRQSDLAQRYRYLMKDVLGPIQQECLELIMNKRLLFTHNSRLAEYLLEYMLMASSYKVIFSRWNSGDFSIHFSSNRFPPELIEHIHMEYT